MVSDRLVEWVENLEGDHLAEVVRRVYKAMGNAVAVRRRGDETYLLYQDAAKDPDAEGFDGVVWVATDPPAAPDLKEFRELRDGIGAERGVVVDRSGMATDADPREIAVLDAAAVAAAVEEQTLAAGAEPDESTGNDGVSVEEWIPPPPAGDEAAGGAGPDDGGDAGDAGTDDRGDDGQFEADAPAPGGSEPASPDRGSPPAASRDRQRARPTEGGEDPPRSGGRDPAPEPEGGPESADRRATSSGRARDPGGRADRGNGGEPRRQPRRDPEQRRPPERPRERRRFSGPRNSSAWIVAGLVVAVAVLLVLGLVVTSGGSGAFLQSKSEQTGQESTQMVTGLTAVDTSASVTGGGNVDELVVVLERAPGAGTVELSGGSVEVIAESGTGSAPVSDPAVSVAVVNDDDGSLSGGAYRLNSTEDRVRLTIALGPDGVVRRPAAGTPATVRIKTADGATTVVEVKTPTPRVEA